MPALLDTHQHLVCRAAAGYAWTARVPALAGRDFLVADYRRLTEGLGIDGTLFMETGVDDADVVAEARHVAALAKDPSSGIRGLVVGCRPEAPGFEAWLDEARGLGAVGLRRILHVMPDDVSQGATFRANVNRIGAAGLTFDVCMKARQLPLARALAQACEGTRLVLDHCGVPDIAAGALDPWRQHMVALAELPNVACKLSGLLAYCPPRPATWETIRPYVDHVLATFGPSRICWGSDWPVVGVAATLPEWIATTRAILGTLSGSEAEAIANGTARRLYGLP